ncbi:MAG: endonuclease/exonuclease/phosphatase family protein [Candidatus Poribacteria bacterium]|nr:endonuclease/exonuclease/phosphatase family protein [Candidatus Poribacteria bacterium]
MIKKLNFYSKFSKFVSSIKIMLLVFGILLNLTGCERISAPMLPDDGTLEAAPLTAMTYNVYVGSSAEPLLAVENLLQVPQEVANMYNNVMASDFPGRAAAIAKSIKTYQPHLIGLQEISLIRRQSPGDRITGGLVEAEEVVLDFLQILMDALQAEGLSYQVAAQVANLDIEMPMFTDTGIDDVRLTDYDVILSRSDVVVSRPMSANYTNALTIEMLGLEVPRGYAAVDATVSGITYRVINTHLEAEIVGMENRVAQAQELVNNLQDETLPIILLGDFNTRAPDGTVYQILLSAGYVDVWQMDSEGTGKTCCQDDDIRNEVSDLSVRIDQIFVRNLELPTSVMTHTVGDKPSDRLPSGLWPSDHAGVVAHLLIPPFYEEPPICCLDTSPACACCYDPSGPICRGALVDLAPEIE